MVYAIASVVVIFVIMISQSSSSVSMLTSIRMHVQQSNMTADSADSNVWQGHGINRATNDVSSFNASKGRHNQTSTSQQVPKYPCNTRDDRHADSRGSTNTNSSKLYMVISFVNGIYHSEDEVNELSEYIKQQFKGEVRPFYNPSSGSWVKDATKAGRAL